MKRKTIVLLSSVLASATLVGGAFAAFAVTDNADPFGINVTPGDLDVDDTTYVTLKWGDTTGLTGVGNLKVGENRKAGVVSLKATPAYTGVFTLNLSDITTVEKQAADAKLLDYLNVYVYDGSLDLVGEEKALPAADPIATILKADETKELSINVLGTQAGHELTVFVNFDNSANPVYPQIKDDKVYLEVDWSPKAGDEATDQVVYFTKPNDWAKVYAYAWDGGKTNAEWPGVEMIHAYDDVYQISIPSDTMVNIIFNDNDGHQTDDLTFTGFDPNTAPYWNGTAWAAKPAQSIGLVMSATVDDEQITLNNIKEAQDTNRAVYKINLTAGQVIKFKEGNTDVHFYTWIPNTETEDPDDGTEHDDGTSYTATVNGLHTFYYNKDSHMYVGQPEPEVVYYVVGRINGSEDWLEPETYNFIANPGNEGEYMLENPIALKQGDGIKVKTGTTYYPDGNGNEFNVTADGNYQIYFRPTGGVDGWYEGYFFVAPQA